MNSFSAHLQKIFSKHNPTDIDELVLDDNMETDGTLSEEQKTALEEYVNLVHLSLGNIGLKSIKNLPRIKGLMILSLNDNELTGDDLEQLNDYYHILNKLKLSRNKISDINKLSSLSKLRLRKIEVEENPFTKEKNYREKLFSMLKSVKR